MDSDALVASQIKAGRELLDALRRAGIRVAIAMWLWSDESHEYRLMLASTLTDKKGPHAAYEQMRKILNTEQLYEQIPLSRISMVGTKNPVAKAVARAIKAVPKLAKGLDFRIHNGSLNGIFLQDAYIYGASRDSKAA